MGFVKYIDGQNNLKRTVFCFVSEGHRFKLVRDRDFNYAD